jgi:hypothetical protein
MGSSKRSKVSREREKFFYFFENKKEKRLDSLVLSKALSLSQFATPVDYPAMLWWQSLLGWWRLTICYCYSIPVNVLHICNLAHESKNSYLTSQTT